jgi:hypothetical protein
MENNLETRKVGRSGTRRVIQAIQAGNIPLALLDWFHLFSSPSIAATETPRPGLPVIKDSEAVQYVGRNVEVRGFVVSVATSPLGTTFIIFGREYPKSDIRGVHCSRVKNSD